MTCQKCGARNQIVRELGGDVVCLSCGTSPGTVERPVKPRAKACSKGHPMAPGERVCWTCKDEFGRSSPVANAIQRAAMKGAVKR